MTSPLSERLSVLFTLMFTREHVNKREHIKLILRNILFREFNLFFRKVF